jgi:hypothetical protein
MLLLAWLNTGSLNYARYWHASSILNNGQVLVNGGQINSTSFTNSAEFYNASTDSWTTTGNLNYLRYRHTSSLLTNGQVLVAGGSGSSFAYIAELYNQQVIGQLLVV